MFEHLNARLFLSAHTREGGYPVSNFQPSGGIKLDSRLRGSERSVGEMLVFKSKSRINK